ncbi:hypothetical protein FOA52_005957 [Chlamydomonas sp. UWO 241]|nr:hypothetical protein FOA52_005957 [Chlamydomonas sp. UWO 241]
MPAFSSSVAATLRVSDVSDCFNLGSIDFVCSCVQLTCLWMPGCESVPDLLPLAACSETFEQQWMAGIDSIVNLAPLKACIRLRKLDLRGCKFDPAQLEDLRLACTQPADPASVQLEGLVHDLQPNLLPIVQAKAARTLADASVDGGLEAQTAIVAAGAIPALVQLVGSASPEDVQAAAAWALGNLALNHAQNQAAIAGAILTLVKLLGPDSTALMHVRVAHALRCLAADNAQNQADIAAADAVPLW